MKNENNAWEMNFSQTLKRSRQLRFIALAAILMVGIILPSFASGALQEKTVTGKVTDNSGMTLPGVTVIEKGTTNGTVTDMDGAYSITVSASDAILQFSFVGMESQEIDVAGKTTINVVLDEGTIGLDEVIAVGYGSMERNNVTGAIASIKADEIMKAPVPNVVEALRGQVSGVKVSRSSGQPGSGVDFLIRGKNSLTSGNAPLIVIDGVPITGGSMSEINTADIATINILKDAAAASIYGASGANGVVLITTKNGASGKPSFSVEATYGTVDLAMRPEVFNADEYIQLKRDAALGVYGSDVETAYSQVDTSVAAILSDPVEYANYLAGKSTDWQDFLLRKGNTKNVSMTLSGGTDKFHYYMNGDAYLEDGIAQYSDYNRFSFRVNADYSPYSFLTLGTRVQASKSFADETGLTLYQGNADFGDFVGNTPLGRIENENGELVPTMKGDQFQYNPLWRYRESDVGRERSRFYINPWIELKIVDGLSYRMNAFVEERGETYHEFYSSLYSISVLGNDPVDNEMRIQQGQTWTYLWDNILSYRKVFNDVHSVDATFVYGMQTYDRNTLNVTGKGSPTDLLSYYDITAVASESSTVSYTPDEWAKQYYVGRVGYSFDERYNVTGTIRRDASSKFGPGNRIGYFPSIAAAWNLHNESFLQGVTGLEALKYRISYGVMGNDNISNFAYLATTNNASYVFDNTVYTGKTTNPNRPGNPYLQWETSKQFNTGIDFGFIDNRVTGTIDYYNINTSDLLLTEKLPSTSGSVETISNVGRTKSWGAEASVTGRILDGQLKWDMVVNLAMDRNEVVSLSRFNVDADGNPLDDPANGWFIGQDIDVIYDYQFEGIYQLGEEEEAAAMHPTIRRYGPGDAKIADLSGPDGVPDGVIDTNDKTFLGSATPAWYGGVRNTLRYKGLEFTVLLEIVEGVEKINGYYGGLQGRDNQIKVDYWTPNNPSNVFPQPNTGKGYDFSNAVRLRDASFVSLRNVALSYNLPSKVLTNLPFKGLALSIRGNNLKYFTEYTDSYSPEINPWNYPITQTWNFSAKISF